METVLSLAAPVKVLLALPDAPPVVPPPPHGASDSPAAALPSRQLLGVCLVHPDPCCAERVTHPMRRPTRGAVTHPSGHPSRGAGDGPAPAVHIFVATKTPGIHDAVMDFGTR